MRLVDRARLRSAPPRSARATPSGAQGPPAWAYGLLLLVWAILTAALAQHGWWLWRTHGHDPWAGAVLALVKLAESVGAFYLLGFVAKSAGYLAAPSARPGARAGGAPAPGPGRARGVAVLYLTAGDFDPGALDSLLALESRGPRLLVLHDDGDDDAERGRMAAFLERHPRRGEWQVAVWHRPRRTGGKAGAVNWVVDRLDPSWEILLLCDSDSIALERDALERTLAEFDDPSVAVVQFRNAGVSEPGEPVLCRRLALAIDVFDVFAVSQARWGYVPFFGHNALVRLQALRDLHGLTPGFFSDDLDFSARLTLRGRRIVYRSDVAFGERHPADWQGFRHRARKWALGCMQVVRARGGEVVTARGLPLAQRIGLLEFMGFYPAQALLVAGLLLGHLSLPWLLERPGGSLLHAATGALVVAGLFSPTLAWAVRHRRLRQWPALAWSCALVYGGSILATVRGVLDGLSSRERPWVPTNLAQARGAVPREGWLEAALGLALVLVPWTAGSASLASPAAYVFVAVLLFSPLTFAAYREPPARARKPARAAAAAGVALVIASAAAGTGLVAGPAGVKGLGVEAAGAAPRATVSGDRLLLDASPFAVRGVHYSPWLPGTGPDGRSPYPGPEVVARDLRALKRLGANTLLVHSAPGWALDQIHRAGFVTLYAFSVSWSDTSEPAFRLQAERILSALDTLRAHDGVIAWILGNEVPTWVVEQLGARAVEQRLAVLAARARLRDPGRLLGHANWPPTKQLELPFLDLACFNLYPAWPYEVSVKGFGPYLREVLTPLAGGRPLLVTEFGINSLEAGEERQARVLADCWREIEGSRAVGGVLFEWCDEWWKNYDNPVAAGDYWMRAYDPDDAARHDQDPEEHYGIVRTDRSAKPAYGAMLEAWRARRAARPWAPWAVLGALLLCTWLALGLTRRRTRDVRASAPALLPALLLSGGLGIAAPAAADAWTHRDSVTGEFADDQLGWALADGGDLDGDGVGDVAVGARFFLVGPDTAAGAVYVYRLGQPAGSPPLRLEGRSNHEHFGENLAGGHDVDGDGLADLAVGAPLRAGPAGSAAGAVDLFRGGALGTRWGTLSGEAQDDWFGQSVALGDLDGDGYAEVIVGAPYNDRNGSAAGAVFVFRGGPSPPTAPWKVFTGEASNDQFGWAVAYVGDVDGDGYGDVVAGARHYGDGSWRARGKVYLFRGGPLMDETPDGAWLGEAKDDWFGNAVAGPGDVDGGGRADVLVGAPYNDRGGSAAGACYLFRGEDPPGSAPAAIYVGESPDAHLGWTVTGAGDVDGDGRPDVASGARLQASGDKPAAGRAYVYPGGASLSTTPIGTVDGEAADDWLGHAVAGVPGFFSAGRGTLAPGAPYNDAAASAAGRAYVLGQESATGVADAAALDGVLWAHPNPALSRVQFRWRGRAPSHVEVADVAGRRVRRLPLSRDGEGGSATWDCTDRSGARVAAGLYFARVVMPGAAPAAPRPLRLAILP